MINSRKRKQFKYNFLTLKDKYIDLDRIIIKTLAKIKFCFIL